MHIPSLELLGQSLLSGLFIGGLYGLLGLGLSLSWGMLRQINLAHFALAFLGAYLTYQLSEHFKLDPFVTMVIIVPGFFLIGMAMHWVFARFKVTPFNSLLVTFGLAVIIESLIQWIWSADYRKLESSYSDVKFQVGQLFFPLPELMTLLIARSGTEMTGASAIAGSLAATTFMLPLALGNATCVLCAQHLGAQSPARARHTAWLGLSIALGFALLTALLIGLLREPLAHLYTSDHAVAAIAISLFALVAAYHVFDALQCVLAFILRAWKIAVAPMVIFAGSLWGVGVGGGWWLAHGLGWQARGFWFAAALAVAFAATGLFVLLLRHWAAENARGSA